MSGQPPNKQNFVQRIPEGDDRTRRVCDDCGFVDYENPKIVVGSVASWDDRVLLCKRAIEPRLGYWTIPAGYLEQHESAADGVLREAWEEAYARLEVDQLMAVYSIPRISQIQLIYRARLVSDDVAPGAESLEVALFRRDEIPWDDIAFPSVHWALGHYYELLGVTAFAPRANPPQQTGNYPAD